MPFRPEGDRNGLRGVLTRRTPVLALLGLALCALTPVPATAQTVQAPFDDDYSTLNLGAPPGVPGSLGGLTIKAGDTTKLLIGGAANGANGAVYEIPVTRDADGHITGFAGTAALHATAPNIDGGLAYGPDDVLFFTQYSNNGLGQIKPGSSSPDKLTNLATLGVAGSVGTLQFVPDGFPGAGSLKLASYSASQWYDATVVPDGSGAFTVGNVTNPVGAPGGPEGIVYIDAGSPEFDDQSVLVSEYGNGRVTAYELDGDGNPILATARSFITGLSGAEGAAIDPVTGDFLFSTFGGGDRVIVVRGFALPSPCLADGVITDNDGTDTDATAGVVRGTSGDDVICGSSGDDQLEGLGGDDDIYGLEGNDRLGGGAGDDELFGEGGNDVLNGDADVDTLDGGAGGDTMLGGAGGDTFLGGAGIKDLVRYGPAVRVPLIIDMRSSNGANDGAVGEGDSIGDDVEKVQGGRESDVITGNAAHNIINGGDGDDQLSGLEGSDALYGEGGAGDQLTGDDDGETRDLLNCGAAGGSASADPADTVTGCGAPI